MQGELQGGDDGEVVAGPPQGPVQVRIRVCGDMAPAALGVDDVERGDAVGDPAVPPAEPAEPAAEGEAGDAEDWGAAGQAVPRGGGRQLAR